ncbi:GNAT family N-acetyltransferase [Streptomyces iconiensis]|uniref:GNAT family N-acetyltransferase n=1 Tax=Streptomyces iconiensis TaxID=1384038 RepID=A0ABT7A8T8_9ACTN|nr:GNAT family N-acetyltransferase [Streptomyces iconiensis]MDJ1137764.1 GNAT family N-acetyltransferase [Streptomyces iconiensis]
MTFAIPPAVPAGSLAASAQPSLTSPDGELLLRPWQLGDAPVVQSAYRDPDIRRWHLHHVDSAEEARAWIAKHELSWRQERAAQWVVTRADSGEAVGRTALRWMDLLHGVAECAYWVLPHARGKAVAPRALATVADWAGGTAGFHRLELAHSTDNSPSCRVAVKSGFALEGTRRDAHLHADGWHDMHVHARILN